MITLNKKYEKEGFYIVSPIFYKERTFVKCGNRKNNNIYYFEIKNNDVVEIDDKEILNYLQENYSYNVNPIVF